MVHIQQMLRIERTRKMKIIYYDGAILYGSSIYVTEKSLIVDDIYEVPLIEVQRIEEGREDE